MPGENQASNVERSKWLQMNVLEKTSAKGGHQKFQSKQ